MNRAYRHATVVLLIALLCAGVTPSRVLCAPKALAVCDFANETGVKDLNWLGIFLPEAIAECLERLPGIASGPATVCEPKPYAAFWVYRVLSTETELRRNPPEPAVRATLDELVEWSLAQPDPLGLPANPDLRLTGSLGKRDGAISITMKLAGDSGQSVGEVTVITSEDRALTTAPGDAVAALRPLLGTPAAARGPAPSLGTQSAEAAYAYLEARSFQREFGINFLVEASKQYQQGPGANDSQGSGANDSKPTAVTGPVGLLYTGREYAIRRLRRAISADEKFSRPHARLGTLYLRAAQLPANAGMDRTALKSGRDEFASAVRLGDRSPGVLTGLAAALMMMSQDALSSGDAELHRSLLEQSVRAWLVAVDADPSSASTRRSAAEAYLGQALDTAAGAQPKIVNREAFDAGLRLMREAVKLAPDCREMSERLRDVLSLDATPR